MSYSPGDILLVFSPFEESEGEKDRRAIYWDSHDDVMIMTKITSTEREQSNAANNKTAAHNQKITR